MVKLDLGAGPNTKEGFEGVDILDFGQKHQVNLAVPGWPWDDGAAEEVHSSHFLEHLDGGERIVFWNELYRVLAPEGKAQIITPHWASCRAYGDPTHKWPPISEFAFYYLSEEWRRNNAPHVPLECNFDATWGYSLHPALAPRNQEYQQFAIQNYKEACQDIVATVVKRPRLPVGNLPH